MTKNVIQEVLEKIKSKNLSPKPRWVFVVKNLFYWILAPLFIIFGGLSFSVIIHMFLTNDWDLRMKIGRSFLGFLVATLPHFWIIVFILFALAGYFYFRKTRSGYRYEFIKLVVYGFLIMVLLGIFFYFSKFGIYIDRSLSGINFYNKFSCANAQMWNRPDSGIISGEIIGFDSDRNMRFMDVDGKPWNVRFHDEMPPEFRKIMEENNNRIKIIGSRFDDTRFDVDTIRPFECGCMMKDCGCAIDEINFPNMRNNKCIHN